LFQQNTINQPVRDFVFPVGTVHNGIFSLKGTAFFIGERGFAVTAAHVTDDLRRGGEPIGLFTDGHEWYPIPVIDMESHPSEDVAVVKLQGNWHSIIYINPSSEHSSCDYELWGYPERAATELRRDATSPEEAESLIRPDLVYNRGYVRRRLSREFSVSIYRGQAFYELSEVGGSCCSGAPVINHQRTQGPWPAFAVYIGEETSEALTAVGYATRCDSLAQWIPTILGGRLDEQRASSKT